MRNPLKWHSIASKALASSMCEKEVQHMKEVICTGTDFRSDKV